MARFFEVQGHQNVCYVNRDSISTITVSNEPDEDGDYVVEYDNAEGTIATYHKTFDEAKAEARKIAVGNREDEMSEGTL